MKKSKNFEDLVFSDDFMFGKVMEDKQLCREVLTCLLQRNVGELQDIQNQREYQHTSDGKPIKLDVYSQDQHGNVYDAEMQNLNHKSVEFHQLPKRSRFYQASIDTDFLNKNDSYRMLPESTVMFICTFDPFGKGMNEYIFRESCAEASDLLLNDGTSKVFYNCTYEGDDLPEDLKQLYDYILHGKVEGELTERIHNAVVKGRKNELWRAQYMKERTILQDARDEGRTEGRTEERRLQIANMLKKEKSPEAIAEFCGYPISLILEVQRCLEEVK